MTQLSDLKIRKHNLKISLIHYCWVGLALFVFFNGSKRWHFRFYWEGKPCRISLWSYPAVNLQTTRILRQEAHSLLTKGIDHRDGRRALKQEASTTSQPIQLLIWRLFT